MDQYYHQYNTIHTLEYIGRMVHVYKIAIIKVTIRFDSNGNYLPAGIVVNDQLNLYIS